MYDIHSQFTCVPIFFLFLALSPLLCKVHEQSKQILSSHYFPLLLFFCTESKPPNSTPTRLLSVRSMCQCFVVVHSVFSDRPTILEASRDFFSFHFCNSKTFIGIRVLVCLVCVCVCVSRCPSLPATPVEIEMFAESLPLTHCIFPPP